MISVEHLTKYYGEHLAVDDISFEISEGHVYGFLGPNGAGKSTTMNIITGCLSATSGKVLIDGHDIYEEPNVAKKLIGYLPEQPPLYMNESPMEYLRFVGEAKGLRGAELSVQIADVIEKTGITNVKDRRISTLSKGYKQRVGIAQALLGNPKVIILDEPTVGLDPIQILEIRDLITEMGRTHTVIFSSHILSEVQAICDRIIMIAKGKLAAFGDPEELQKKLLAQNEIVITTNAADDELKYILNGMDNISEITVNTSDSQFTTAHIKSGHDDIYDLSSRIFRAFADSKKTLCEMMLKKGNLEDIFIELSDTAVTDVDSKTMNTTAAPKTTAEDKLPEESEDVTE